MTPYDDVFRAMAERGVTFVVVGGMAVVLHGHARLTIDLDLVVDLAAEPALAAIDVLSGLGLRCRLPVDARDFADPVVREEWVRDRHLQVLSLYDPADPLREVDLFATHPIPFDELLADSTVMSIGDVEIRVASVGHIIRMKQQAARPQDLADVEALQELYGGAND